MIKILLSTLVKKIVQIINNDIPIRDNNKIIIENSQFFDIIYHNSNEEGGDNNDNDRDDISDPQNTQTIETDDII